jgi:hypothetical protein
VTELYYYLVLLNALTSLAVAITTYWRNRQGAVGPTLGLTMLIFAVWLVGFAQYFQPWEETVARRWVQVTLTAAIAVYPLLFHSVCALVDQAAARRRWIVAAYLSTGALLVLLWQGNLVVGLRSHAYMHHYVRYDRHWYPVLGGFILFWQVFGLGILVRQARRRQGYQRTQLVYFIIAWLTVFLTTNSIILPLEYDINIQPFGFFLMPWNLVLLAYVMGKARLADFNVVVARVLLFTVMLLVVALVSLLAIGGITLVAPGFMNQPQLLFTVGLVTVIGFLLTATLPQLMPRAERVMQERLFGDRHGYQEQLAGLTQELQTLTSVEQVLQAAVSNLHTHMHLTRVLALIEDRLSG